VGFVWNDAKASSRRKEEEEREKGCDPIPNKRFSEFGIEKVWFLSRGKKNIVCRERKKM
jgi:hypothetical protein